MGRLGKAGFPGVGRCENARSAGAGIGQRPQPIPDRPAYNLQLGRHPPTYPTYLLPDNLQGFKFKEPSGLFHAVDKISSGEALWRCIREGICNACCIT